MHNRIAIANFTAADRLGQAVTVWARAWLLNCDWEPGERRGVVWRFWCEGRPLTCGGEVFEPATRKVELNRS
jgi:hypothetical protein